MIPQAQPELPRAAPQEAAQPVLAPPAPDALDVIVTAFSGLAFALSARAILFVSIIGAFILAVMAVNRADGWGLGVLIAYATLIVVPLCWLEYKRREA